MLRRDSRAQPDQSEPPASGRLVRLPLPESTTVLVAALRAGRTDAREALYDRYCDDVERILYRTLGPDQDIPDILQDVFVTALDSLSALKDPESLGGWLAGIAVRKVLKHIRRRRRSRFIRFMAPEELPEAAAVAVPADVSEALKCTYLVLDRLPPDERVAFALRHIDGMDLASIAQACEISLATVKRRISRGQSRFVNLARKYDVLEEWIHKGHLRELGGGR
jgi:RNA polymerase sigma-70 factor, ECF subfamily